MLRFNNLTNQFENVPDDAVESAPPVPGPEPSSGGLYSIYSQPNPYRNQAEGLRQMAFRQQPAGAVDFASPIMAFMAGRAGAKESAFERDRASQIKDYEDRRKKWESVKNNAELLNAEKARFKEFMPTFQTEYNQRYRSAEAAKQDPQKAVAGWAAERVNKWAKENGITNVAYFKALNLWGDGTATFLASTDGKNFVNGKMLSTGEAVIPDGQGGWKPADGYIPVKDFKEMMDAKSAKTRAEAAGRGGVMSQPTDLYKSANGQAFRFKGSFEDAVKKGAVKMQIKSIDDLGTTTEWVSVSGAPAPAQGNILNSMSPQDRAAFVQKFQAQQAQGQQPAVSAQPAAPAAAPLRQKQPDGRVALFDANTKEFIRYE